MTNRARNSILCVTLCASWLVAFTLGYFVKGLRDSPALRAQSSQVASAEISNIVASSDPSNKLSDDDSLLETVNEAIDPDNWLQPGGTNTIEPLPSNIVACTAEDIFGSREEYLRMFDVSSGEAAAGNDPFEVTADDDPFHQ